MKKREDQKAVNLRVVQLGGERIGVRFSKELLNYMGLKIHDKVIIASFENSLMVIPEKHFILSNREGRVQSIGSATNGSVGIAFYQEIVKRLEIKVRDEFQAVLIDQALLLTKNGRLRIGKTVSLCQTDLEGNQRNIPSLLWPMETSRKAS